jgi:hypothetical protein
MSWINNTHLPFHFAKLHDKYGYDYWPKRFRQFLDEDLRKLDYVWVVRRVEEKLKKSYYCGEFGY